MAQNTIILDDRPAFPTAWIRISNYVLPLSPCVPPSRNGTKLSWELEDALLHRLHILLNKISGNWSRRILSGSATTLDLIPHTSEAIQNVLDPSHERPDPLLEATNDRLAELGLTFSHEALSDASTPVWYRAGSHLRNETLVTTEGSGFSLASSLDFASNSAERSPEFYEVASQIQPRSYEEHMLIMEMLDKFVKRVDGRLRTEYGPYPHEYRAPATRPLHAYAVIAKYLELKQ